MRLTKFLTLLPLAAMSPANAQQWAMPVTGSGNAQVIDYQAGQAVPLRAALGYQLMVELAPDEHVKNIAVGDSSGWQVNVDKDGNRFFLKALRADQRTNLTVVTSIRNYSFELEALAEPAAGMPYTVAFHYSTPRATSSDPQYVDVSAATRRLTRYRISGDRELRPESVSDDGRRTFITWPVSAPIPAIYAPDRSGKEVLVNGTMGTDDVYVVDGVPQLLVFRIDGSSARAQRVFPPRSR